MVSFPVAVSEMAEVLLILVALLSGAELGRAIFPRTSTITMWESEGHVGSGATRDPSFAAATSDAGHAPWGRSQMTRTVDDLISANWLTTTTTLPAQRQIPSLVQRSSTQDWRLALQHIATWTRLAEAPAGANHYPVASPSPTAGATGS